MRNERVRAWYLQVVSKIAELSLKWTEQDYALEERSRRVWQLRRDARLQARAMMENPSEVEQLRARDLQIYGNPDGPTFDQLVEAHRLKGCSGDEAFERIIKGAQTTNTGVNEQLRPKDRNP
jgi:hypothetical protein